MNPPPNTNASNDNTNQEDEKIVLQPFNHFKQLPPLNDFIAKIWSAFDSWFQIPKDKCKEISILMTKLLAGVYITDDLVDNSVLRRGIPTSHLVYGRSRTIYSSIFGTVSAITKFDDPKVVDVFITMGLKLFQGQLMEMYYTRNGICPTEDEYRKIVLNKTSSTVSFGLLLQQTFASQNKTTNFEQVLVTLGLFIQICNDYISLKSSAYADLKTFGDDITEGIFTFPIIHGIQSRLEDHRLMNIMKQKTSDYNVKRHFVKLLEEFGSLDYTLRTLKKLKHELVEETKKVAPNPDLEKILDDGLNHIEALVM
ncbi:hypothetical protein Zmor_027717 [Zophobas morio]|uniref:Geranylgeranyl pyrophosphate synthase n=1 Tax=Zophobas morio TaxID=2755281 RepID=A0AA38HRB1_9CUCU|nr:hypothetical protein Zmor_027717 [Zophobas morio]